MSMYFYEEMPAKPNTDGRMMTRQEVAAKILRLQAAAEACEPDDALRITMLQEIQVLRTVIGDRPMSTTEWGCRTAGEVAYDITVAHQTHIPITLPAPAFQET